MQIVDHLASAWNKYGHATTFSKCNILIEMLEHGQDHTIYLDTLEL